MHNHISITKTGDVHGGNLHHLKELLNLQKLPSQIIDFSVNINLKGPPKAVKNYLKNLSYKDCLLYPDLTAYPARKALAKAHNIPIEEISSANGSTELFSAFLKAISPEKLIIAAPAYTGYEEIASINNIPVLYKICAEESNNFNFNFDNIKLKKNELLFICSPNNPTGSLINKKAISNLAEKFPLANFAIDESFVDYLPEPEKNSFFYGEIPPNIIAFKSLTKFFGIAGIRLGICRADKSITAKILSKIPTWNVNSIAQNIATLLYSDKTYLHTTKEKNILIREKFSSQLQDLPLKIFPSHTNFILCKILSEKSNKNLIKYLLSKGFLLRDCSRIPGLDEKFIRIAILSEKLNSKLASEIKNYFSTH